jgi:integrase
MARKLLDFDLRDPIKRRKAAADKKHLNRDTFWSEVKPQEIQLGWRPKTGQWLVRRYVDGRYQQRAIKTDGRRCIANDEDLPANGIDILNYRQAFDAALETAQAAAEFEAFVPGTLDVRVTVREACEDYVEQHLRVMRKRSREIGLMYAAKVYPTLGTKLVRNLKRGDLEAWKIDTAAASSKSDANRCLSYLKAALTFAFEHEENKIPSNQAWKSVKQFPGVKVARCDFYLDAEQVQRLLAAMSGPLNDLCKAAFLTGCRPPHELSGIRVKDFDDERGTCRIVQSKIAKGREITLSDEAASFFAQLAQDKRPGDLLFPRDQFGRPWVHGDGHSEHVKNDYHIRPFRAAVRRAGLPPCTLYVLRHSFISLAIATPGCDLLMLAKHCGTSVKQIEAHYGHYRDDSRKAKVNAMSPRLSLRVVA